MDKTITLTTILEARPTLTEEESYSDRQPHFMTKENLYEKVEQAYTEILEITKQISPTQTLNTLQQEERVREILAEIPKKKLIVAAEQAFLDEGKHEERFKLHMHYIYTRLYALTD